MTTDTRSESAPPEPAASQIHGLWDELADFGAHETDDALVHAMRVLSDLVGAGRAFWLGAVRLGTEHDPLGGWRIRAVRHMVPTPDGSIASATRLARARSGSVISSPRTRGTIYAFSRVTARTGMSFLVLIYYVVAVRPDVLLASPPLELIVLAMILTAVGCFVLPLRGMHRRIAAEKDRALARTAVRFEAVTARLHERIEQGDVADADKLAMQLAGIVTERDAIARVSTWPWEPTTATAFVTTRVLPAIVWMVQRVLARTGF